MTNSSTVARRSVRNVLVAALSALTVAFVGLFALAPTSPAMAAKTSTSTIAGTHVVFYGTATDADGEALPGVKVTVYHLKHHRRHVDKVVHTNAAGLYRVDKKAAKGRYYVEVSDKVKGKRLTVRTHFNARPGHAYEVSVQIVHKGLFTFLPVTHY